MQYSYISILKGWWYIRCVLCGYRHPHIESLLLKKEQTHTEWLNFVDMISQHPPQVKSQHEFSQQFTYQRNRHPAHANVNLIMITFELTNAILTMAKPSHFCNSILVLVCLSHNICAICCTNIALHCLEYVKCMYEVLSTFVCMYGFQSSIVHQPIMKITPSVVLLRLVVFILYSSSVLAKDMVGSLSMHGWLNNVRALCDTGLRIMHIYKNFVSILIIMLAASLPYSIYRTYNYSES